MSGFVKCRIKGYTWVVKQNWSGPAVRLGFVQASGVAAYCSLVGILFYKGNEIFGRVPNYFGPVAFLLLFSVSALICGIAVFYHPYRIFFEGKKQAAADLVVATAGWLLIYFTGFLLLAAFGNFI
ncbi:hypothetical protein A2Z33_01410 [Candidatus Gottesmanbacteria bacterium RBG_16_52_11]|uniref:Uncharacterized protein n=1 Tax=Candidatus Gottesmanbacteria bacterium RBG_16_52_11 TaxID=1798374 RepID=A0A1F5YP33_9BACT|nr:MAG: hypothetical protein A2Z33_01410 [Candidatus Gottesmanbacteria bacterium RBG_16_52_11]